MRKALKVLNILGFILFSFSSLHSQALLETPYKKRFKKEEKKFALNKVKTIYKCLEVKTFKNGQNSVKIDTIEIHRYNKKGKLSEIKRFYSRGFRRIVSEYDSIGRIKKESVFDGNFNTLIGLTTWVYDTKDNLIEQRDGPYLTIIPKSKPNEEHYFERGTLKRVTRLSADKTGLIYTIEEFGEDKKLITRGIYELDSKKRLIRYKSSVNSKYPASESYLLTFRSPFLLQFWKLYDK
ncbi:hypothetical protein [Fulvitalea axinellae]